MAHENTIWYLKMCVVRSNYTEEWWIVHLVDYRYWVWNLAMDLRDVYVRSTIDSALKLAKQRWKQEMKYLKLLFSKSLYYRKTTIPSIKSSTGSCGISGTKLAHNLLKIFIGILLLSNSSWVTLWLSQLKALYVGA